MVDAKTTEQLEKFAAQGPGAELDTNLVIQTPAKRRKSIAKPSNTISELSLDYLRLAAETYYVSDLNGISVPDLWELPQFHSLPMYKLVSWSHDHNWVAKRKEFQAKCVERVQDAVASKLVKLRLEQMDRVKELCDDMWTKIKNTEGNVPLKTGSYEGVVKAYLQAVLTMEKLRDSVTMTIGEKTIHPDKNEVGPELELSPEEYRKLALDIVKQRQITAPTELIDGEVVE